MTEAPRPCECPAAGFCQRHGVEKNATLHRLCQTKDSYRQAWDEKKMPFQRAKPVAVARKAKSRRQDNVTSRVYRAGGVGSKVKEIINAAEIKISGCACNSKASEWDRNGVAWCDEHRSELIGWLESQAIANKINLVSAGINLAKSHPILAAKIAAIAALQPHRLNHVAAACIVGYAIDHSGKYHEPVANIPVFMTAAPRCKATQEQAVRSVVRSGLGPLTVCCEPGLSYDDLAVWCPDVVAIVHEERLGNWRNFTYALRQGLRTSSQYFVTMEDDAVLHPQLGKFLSNNWTWPSENCGCLQLYASAKLRAKYPAGTRSRLDKNHAFDVLGACAFMFRRDAAETLVNWADSTGWRGGTGHVVENPADKKAADTFVGEVLTHAGYDIWIHNPSLADHIGVEDSTLGHAHEKTLNRQPLDYPGDDADLFAIFK